MNGSKNRESQRWLKEQLEKFIVILPVYQRYAVVLREVLETATKKITPLAIVQTRPKSIVSFGEKALLKKHAGRYSDPINRMTDLCGGRIIVPTRAEIQIVSDFIKNHYEIDWENSVDVTQRLKPTEFGYRGVHYIVQFKKGVFPTKDINITIPEEVFEKKAEIQLKTILEHAYGVFTHDRAYKGSFQIPNELKRQMAEVAALLETADNDLAKIEDGLNQYASSYGSYMNEEKMRETIEDLKTILEHDPKNAGLAARIGKLVITLGQWEEAIDILKKYTAPDYPAILRDFGIATCKIHKDNPKNAQYREGQKYLEQAVTLNPNDTDAICSWAGTYKGIDEDRVRQLYLQAYEVEPSDPYPLGNYLECEIMRLKDISIISTLRVSINKAIERCHGYVKVNMNMPWVFYDMGKFYLLLGKPYESLTAYAKAIQLSTASFMIDISLASLERISVIKDEIDGFEWARQLLLIGLAVKFPKDNPGIKAIKELKKMASKGHSLTTPIVIISGGTDTAIENLIQDYREVMLEGFWNFHGTIISGWTTTGVCGLAGEIGKKYPDAIRTIGYLPRKLPTGVQDDNRYNEFRLTNDSNFTPQDFLLAWMDIITSGVPLSKVKVLGINGGPISAVDNRIALALGAQVAIIKDSGREADKLLTDKDWADSETLIRLPADRMTLMAFLNSNPTWLDSNDRETIAQAIHNNYRAGKKRVSVKEDITNAPWSQLAENLKESNRCQADDINNKLSRIGCIIVKVTGRKPVKMTFSKAEIELMSEMEHGRWNIERLLDGWKLGPKDTTRKTSPFLVPWAELPEEIKKWDRETVRKIPEFLAKVGLEIRRE